MFWRRCLEKIRKLNFGINMKLIRLLQNKNRTENVIIICGNSIWLVDGIVVRVDDHAKVFVPLSNAFNRCHCFSILIHIWLVYILYIYACMYIYVCVYVKKTIIIDKKKQAQMGLIASWESVFCPTWDMLQLCGMRYGNVYGTALWLKDVLAKWPRMFGYHI